MPKQLKGVTFTGLDSFKHELEVLTAGLVEEANTILLEHANAAKADIAADYPSGPTGNLKRGLVIRPARGIVLAGGELRQTAPHGWIFEHGTKRRENRAGQNRGAMKPRATFEPTAVAYRTAAISQIKFRLYWHGASRVTGEADGD